MTSDYNKGYEECILDTVEELQKLQQENLELRKRIDYCIYCLLHNPREFSNCKCRDDYLIKVLKGDKL